MKLNVHKVRVGKSNISYRSSGIGGVSHYPDCLF